MKYLFAILFLLSITFIKGQDETLSVRKIDSIVKSIDTVSVFGSMIADGGIHKDGEKRMGIFSYNYKFIGDSTHTQLLSADMMETLDYSDYSTFYFYHDSLIYVMIKRHNFKGNKKKIIASGKYYFQNDALIYKEENGTPIKKPEEFLQQAQFFIKDLNSQ